MKIAVSLDTLPGIQDDIDRLTALACRAYGGWADAATGTAQAPEYHERTLIRPLIKLIPALYWELEIRDTADDRVPEGAALAARLPECLGLDVVAFGRQVMTSDTYHAALRGLVAARVAGRPLPGFEAGRVGTAPARATAATAGARLRAVGCRTLLYKVPLTRGDQLRLALRSFGRVNAWFHPEGPQGTPAVSPDLRSQLRDQLAASPVTGVRDGLQSTARVILDLLAYLLPVDHVEALAENTAWARETADRCQPRRIVTGYGFFDAGAFPFYAAECAARGTELVGWQHGGTYGELATPGRQERWERRITDRFLTWGWSDGDPKAVATACPRQHLFRRPRKPRDGAARLLWVSTADSRFTHFIDHTPVGERLEGYWRHQEAILAALPETVTERLVLRPNRNDFGWGLKDMWARRLDAPVFSPAGSDILDEADRCGLVLIDYPGATTFLECLAAGIPFLCVVDPAVYEIGPSQRDAFRALEEAGVVHSAPESAAEEIARALADPEAWAADPVRQRALARIRALAMRRDPGYIRDWLRLIA